MITLCLRLWLPIGARAPPHMGREYPNKSLCGGVTNGIKEKSLEGFVRNRVRMLQTISVYHAFDQVSGKVPMKPSFA